MENEMRKIITIAIILATAAVTTAWAVSTIQPAGPKRGAMMVGGGGAVATRGVISWWQSVMAENLQWHHKGPLQTGAALWFSGCTPRSPVRRSLSSSRN